MSQIRLTDISRTVLDSMSYFCNTQVLTEDNLASLNVLHRLICPSRGSDVHFDCEVETSVDHLLGLLEQRDKPVANSTYRELMELITLVSGCGYFERVPSHGEPLAGERLSVAECGCGVDRGG